MLILLAATLSGLQSGATVTLPPGRQPTVEIAGEHFSPPVIIDAREAIVAGVRITDSSGIIWRGGTIEAPDGMQGNGPGTHGARLQRFRDVTFDGVTFTNAKHGIVSGNGFGLTVRNALFTGLRSDGIDSAGNSDVLIEHNRFIATRPIRKLGTRGQPGFVDGDHPDAVQIWASKDTRSARDITIRDNVVDGETQGFNTFGDQGDGYQRIRIESNRLKLTYPAVITLIHCSDCTIRSNSVEADAGARFPPNIRTSESTGQFCGNEIRGRPDHPAGAPCPGGGDGT